ncbi:chromosome partitioning protein [Rathayibacter sp. AY1D2]|uniref:ParB/RepB/Spo0J family partition protein n=1 Tax=unclassified Rathayibacter TaxID=2609250 RepID=UPI000CE8641F|nr:MULTISPECIES: ParB/RepB/Spo0J family partition protein [unclassified Rathayibacter]PPG79306.1 chromosome partitioning protein [Rathayibacter sp. AY1E5]PPH16049.1 chromosome partitioning protein [Rathayibacter sp. AY1C4]PPH65146.1 chromosome partitioning protein [Rathayibacter sp. AY1D7]PPI13343.1 chromosome partitioning protein [Rathayibacter sp. AY1D2]
MNTTATGTIEHIDPTALVIEQNVRTSAPLTKEFIDSIRQSGILSPVLGRRDEHGNVIVRAGQRRTLASREIGLATIPVYVVEGDDKTAERIVQQIIENDQRAELTTADRTAAWAQLSFEGLSAASIAKRTGTKAATVKAGLAVEESAVARTALHEHELTLDQAAIILEFEDDEEARADLITVATTNPSQFTHTAERHRKARARRVAVLVEEANQEAAGFTVLTRDQVDGEGSAWVVIDPLRTEDGKRVTVEHIATIEPRGVLVSTIYDGNTHVSYAIQDPAAHGFSYAYNAPAAPETEEEKAAKSAERRILLANNRAWIAAETVRRDWITTLLSRKTLPKDAERVIALGLTAHRSSVSGGMGNGNALAHTLLGVTQPSGYHADALAPLVEANPAKARLVALAVVLAGQEANTSKESWRRGDARAAAHFRQLAAWGYALSPVEQVVTGDTTAADAADLS